MSGDLAQRESQDDFARFVSLPIRSYSDAWMPTKSPAKLNLPRQETLTSTNLMHRSLAHSRRGHQRVMPDRTCPILCPCENSPLAPTGLNESRIMKISSEKISLPIAFILPMPPAVLSRFGCSSRACGPFPALGRVFRVDSGVVRAGAFAPPKRVIDFLQIQTS